MDVPPYETQSFSCHRVKQNKTENEVGQYLTSNNMDMPGAGSLMQAWP